VEQRGERELGLEELRGIAMAEAERGRRCAARRRGKKVEDAVTL
jgi:hypothetical protein